MAFDPSSDMFGTMAMIAGLLLVLVHGGFGRPPVKQRSRIVRKGPSPFTFVGQHSRFNRRGTAGPHLDQALTTDLRTRSVVLSPAVMFPMARMSANSAQASPNRPSAHASRNHG